MKSHHRARTDVRGSSKLRVRSLGVSCVERVFDTVLGDTKRLGQTGNIGQDGIGDWERLVEILCELVIDVVSARNALFSKSGLTIGSALITFRFSVVEAVSCIREVFARPSVERLIGTSEVIYRQST